MLKNVTFFNSRLLCSWHSSPMCRMASSWAEDEDQGEDVGRPLLTDLRGLAMDLPNQAMGHLQRNQSQHMLQLNLLTPPLLKRLTDMVLQQLQLKLLQLMYLHQLQHRLIVHQNRPMALLLNLLMDLQSPRTDRQNPPIALQNLLMAHLHLHHHHQVIHLQNQPIPHQQPQPISQNQANQPTEHKVQTLVKMLKLITVDGNQLEEILMFHKQPNPLTELQKHQL